MGSMKPESRRVVLQRTWERSVGDVVSKHCRAVGFDEGVLKVEVTDPETGEAASVKDALYPGDSVVGELVTTDSGLQYYEITVGDGPQPAGYQGW